MYDGVYQKLILPGAVGVLPTDTVYGLVARAEDETAVGRLYELKSREGKPGTLIASSVDQLVELGLKRRYLKPVEQYWPGAVSVIIPCGADLDYLTQSKRSLAVRLPNNKALLELLDKTGPLMTSSANLPGQPTSTDLEQARQYFGSTVDFYIDGGDLSGRQSSTVIRVVDDAIEVLRVGAVKIEEEK